MGEGKAVVLLSGGQDSTTCLFDARRHFGELHALSFHYGQKHAVELDAAKEIGRLAKVESHLVLDVAPIFAALASSSALLGGSELAGEGGIPDAEMPQGLPTSFVPGRNALFFTLAAMRAVQVGARVIVSGVCQTDFSGYPDCRRAFVDEMQRAITSAMPSSVGPLVIETPLMWMTKAETVKHAMMLPGCMEALALSVTCYRGERPGCGECPACELRAKGFAEAGIEDPAR